MKFWKTLKSTGESIAGTLERASRKTSPKSPPSTPRSSRGRFRSSSETSSDPIYEDFIYSSTHNTGVTFVELIKRPGTHLGVIVSGGIDTGLTPKIVDLIPGSWAQRSDVLCIGDVIVSVNGISTETMTQKDLVKTLDVSDRIQLEVKYKLPSYRHRSHSRKISSKVIQITLKKENGSFGIVIRGGGHEDPRRVRPFTVMHVTSSGVASQEGTLRVNDRILSINGVSLRGMKLPELQSLLYRQDGDTVFTVEYDVAVHSQHEQGRPILVEIRKEDNDILGFGLNKCNDSGHVYIESVKQASLAERCGGIHVGDILLSINSKSVSRISDIDAISDLIRNDCSSRVVQLEILPGIFSNARNSQCSMPSPTYSTLSTSSHHRRSKSSSRYQSLTNVGNGSPSPSPSPSKTSFKKVENMRRKFVTFTVELQRDGGPLGLTLATEEDADIPGPIFISGLVENGLAERTKTIRPNDQVMEINGTPIHDKCLNEVIPLLQSPREIIKLKLARLIAIPERENAGGTILRSNSVKLARKPPLPSPSPSPRSLSGINTVSLLTPLLSRASPSPGPLRPVPMEVHKVILFKDKVYEDFGFSVSDGLYDKGIYINRIRKGGPAQVCELLQPFDRILQINDTRTHEFDCCLAVPLIAAAGDKIELLVTRSSNGGPHPEIKDFSGSNGSTKTLSEVTVVDDREGTLKKDDEIMAWMNEKTEFEKNNRLS